MNEEATQKQGAPNPGAASMSGGEDRGFRRPYGKDKDGMGGDARPRGKRRRKVSYLTINKIDSVDYKEVNILLRFLNDRKKIVPARQSGNTAKQQRMITAAILRAREMALLPFVVTEFANDRMDRPPRPRMNRDGGGYRDYRRDDRDDRPQERSAEAQPAAEPAAEPAGE